MRNEMFGFLAAFVFLSATAFADSINDNPADADGWFDITVLKAHVLPDLTLKSFDQVEHCHKTADQRVDYGRGGIHHLESFDCTEYIERRLHATAFKPVPAWTFDNGRLTNPYQLDTPLVQVDTVVPESRLARADFLGFSESNQGGRVNLFKAIGLEGQTREVGKVTLKDGRTGIVHRWFATFQATGHSGGVMIRELPFKPVLVRRQAETQLRYWDRLVGQGLFTDYRIQNGHYDPLLHTYVVTPPNSYDRSTELIR